MKFRKKPVVIEAIQFKDDADVLSKLSTFLGDDYAVSYKKVTPVMLIDTLEGVMTANEGDWIIKGVNGEFYPCKPDIFEKTYERVEGEQE